MKDVLSAAAQFKRAPLNAVDAEDEIDEPTKKWHQQNKTDPSCRGFRVALGEHGVRRGTKHRCRLDGGDEKGPQIGGGKLHGSERLKEANPPS